MSEHMPEHVDALRLARQGRTVQGRYPIAKMSRLAQYLESQQGEALVEAEFGVGEEKHPWLQGRVRADLALICQRCLKPMQQHMDISFQLAMVHSEADAEQLPDDVDAMVVEGDSVSLLEVVEGELMLSLPIVAMHDEKECTATGLLSSSVDAEQAHRENPFSVLDQLKTRH